MDLQNVQQNIFELSSRKYNISNLKSTRQKQATLTVFHPTNKTFEADEDQGDEHSVGDEEFRWVEVYSKLKKKIIKCTLHACT